MIACCGTAAALEAAGVPYAVAGGNAVAAWVSRVDEAAVRNTQAVDIVLRRSDLDRAREALEKAGFIDVELIDQTWCRRFPDELASRLQALLDDPDG